MQYVNLPDNEQHRLIFYLAMEEYLADSADGEYFFMWRVPPTVIYGRNQDVEAEVNLDYCRENGVQVFQRKSGGGCVYADMGNVMLSYVVRDTNVNRVFADYLDRLAAALQSLGFPAVKTEHNDVMVDGKKVSGNAFYAKPHSSIVHGTLLCGVDFDAMMQAITPSREKLASHGVKSVRQRVGNLESDIDSVMSHLKTHFTDSEMTLTQSDVESIRRIESTYFSPLGN